MSDGRKARPLSPREAEAVDMRERGMTIEQIARQMGITKNRVWTLLQHAAQKRGRRVVRSKAVPAL